MTDAEASIAAVAAAARDNGATSFWAGPLRLVPLVKEHYLGFVAASFPHLHHRYERAYPGVEAPRAYRTLLEERVQRVRLQFGFGEDTKRDDRSDVPETASLDRTVTDVTAQLSLPLPLPVR